MPAPKPLVVRAGLSRTFGSIAGFAALGLLSLGIYLLTDAFAHPIDAEAAGIIVAALAIAIAMLLFAFLFKPRKFPEILQPEESARIAQERPYYSAKQIVFTRGEGLRSDLPYQHTFVDRSSIRPRTPSSVQARGIDGK